MHKNSPQSSTLVKLAYGGTRSNHDHTNVDTSLPMVTPTCSLFSLIQSRYLTACLCLPLKQSQLLFSKGTLYQL